MIGQAKFEISSDHRNWLRVSFSKESTVTSLSRVIISVKRAKKVDRTDTCYNRDYVN
ncbi:hypothetical protein EMLAB_27510 [Enterococcus mundtii]|nr:hypothetical protein EMLAB_27510 [Enterococcus mundtii]